MDFLRIDKDNQFLVRQEFDGYRLSFGISIPRKTKKGYLGSKHKTIIDEKIQNRDEAIFKLANLKEEYYSKFLRKEILSLRFYLTPIYYYKVKCPYCGNDAEIMDFIMIMGTDIAECYPIDCRFCPGVKEDDCITWHHIGDCTYLNKDGEEKEIRFSQHYENSGIKYEDFLNNSNILNSKLVKQCPF